MFGYTKEKIHSMPLAHAVLVRSMLKIAGYRMNPTKENKQLRIKIFKRDNDTCQMCGDVGDCIDHIKPISRGGTTSEENLQVLCKPCNSRKGDKHPHAKKLCMEDISHNIDIMGFRCNRCKHVWLPKKKNPKACPRCKTPYWNKPRVRS